jgi:hypothetical protein
MSRKDIELIEAETRRLEALGVVLRNIGAVINPELRVSRNEKDWDAKKCMPIKRQK